MTFQTKGHHEQATFTVTLGCLVENGFDIGLSDYPIFDEAYRETLNQKIKEHYWFREIGQETPALFRFFMKRKMNEIMRFYNPLYESELFKIDPLSNYRLSTKNEGKSTQSSTRDAKHDESSTSKSNSSSEADSSSRTLVSQTPQMQLSGHDDYATNITDATSTVSNTATGDDSSERRLLENDSSATTTEQDYITTVTGLSGITEADAIVRFRNAIINIDMMVIDDLAPLFFGLYSCYSNYM